MPTSPPQTYRHDEVQEILHLAIANQAKAGELSRDQLFEIADELGLSPQDIQEAEREWQGLQRIDQEKQAFMRWRRVQFRQYSEKYLIINGFLLAFDFLLMNPEWELQLVSIGHYALSLSLFIALIWGLFLVLEGWQAKQTEGRTFERKFRKWQRRQWLSQSVHNVLGRLFGFMP